MDSVAEKTIICSVCGIEKPLTGYKLKKMKSGNYSYGKQCSDCLAAYNKAYYQKNAERIKAYGKQWVENNKPIVKARKRDYSTKQTRERLKAAAADYLTQPREKVEGIREQLQKWTSEKRRASANNKRARQLGIEGEIDDLDILRCFRKQDYRCYWCKLQLADDYHVDHRLALSRGGNNSPENIVLSCPSCNLIKWANPEQAFKEVTPK